MAKKTKKPLKEEIKQTYISVVSRSRTHITREANDDDKWDRDDTSTDWDIRGIELTKDGYGDIPVTFPIEENKTYYLLYAIWSTGDSFGHDDGAHCEGIALYLDKDKAYIAEQLIREHADKYREYNNYWASKMSKKPKDFQEFTVKIALEDGTVLPVHASWNGYFDSLDRVDVEAVSLIRR